MLHSNNKMLTVTPTPRTPSPTLVGECPGAPMASRVRVGGTLSAFSRVKRELFPPVCPGAPRKGVQEQPNNGGAGSAACRQLLFEQD